MALGGAGACSDDRGGHPQSEVSVEMTGSVGRVERPPYAWVAVGLQLFTSLMAIPVGVAMIADPNGSPLGIPHEWIAASPFGSFLLPGITLLAMNGLGQLAAAILVWRRHPVAPWLTGALGVGLMIWIVVQVLTVPFWILQPLMFAVGAAEGLVALAWLRRLGAMRLK
jgi:hypothetical protein